MKGVAPFGYAKKKLEREKGFTLVPIPEEAEAIRLIFDLYTRGEQQPDGSFKRLGLSLISRRLNNLRIKPRKSDAWVSPTVRDMLANPVYIGKIRWNWRPDVKTITTNGVVTKRPRRPLEECEIIDGLHEAIVDEGTWNLAQELMKSNPPHPGPTQMPMKNPLSGIVYCAFCGRSMIRRPYNNGTPDGLLCPLPSCANVSSQLFIVERHIIEALKNWLSEYSIEYTGDNAQGSQSRETATILFEKAVKKLDADISNTQKQIANIYDLLEQGIYTTEKFLERSALLAERLSALEEEKSALVDKVRFIRTKDDAKRDLAPKIKRVLEVYFTTENPSERNALLKEVIESVLYKKTVGARWHGSVDDFDLVLSPRLPKYN